MRMSKLSLRGHINQPSMGVGAVLRTLQRPYKALLKALAPHNTFGTVKRVTGDVPENMMPVLSAGKRGSRRKHQIHVMIADPCSKTSIIQTPVIQTLDNVIHQKNYYPSDKYQGNQLLYPLDRDLSGGQRYPPFEKLDPGL